MSHVVFPPVDFWTNPTYRKSATMTDQPAPVNRPLTDAERALLLTLATRVIADQSDIPHNDGTCRACSVAATALESFVDEGEVHIRGDAYDCILAVGDNRIVHATREWLSFHADHPEAIDYDKHRHPLQGGE